MPTEKKARTIDMLEKVFKESNMGVLTNYQGLTTVDLTGLRRKLQRTGGDYKVVKNTLAFIAAEKAGKGYLGPALTGPVAIAYGVGDSPAPARIVSDFLRDNAKTTLTIKAGYLGDRLLTAEQVKTLAILPSREVLLARALGQMKAPIAALLGSLNSPLRGLAYILQARMKQLEGN